MDKSKLFLIVTVALLISSVFLGVKYFSGAKELQRTRAALETQKTNGEILSFTKLFIDEVLKAKTEVNFETRLKLENAVRDLGDEKILAQWSKFVDSKTESGAQEEVKNLLEMLVSKIKA